MLTFAIAIFFPPQLLGGSAALYRKVAYLSNCCVCGARCWFVLWLTRDLFPHMFRS